MDRHKGVSGGKLNVAVISAGDYFFPGILAEFDIEGFPSRAPESGAEQSAH